MIPQDNDYRTVSENYDSVTSYLLLLFFLELNLPQLLLVSVDGVTATTRRPHKLSF